MRMRYCIALTLGILLAAPAGLLAQAPPATAKPPAISVILSYHEDNSGTFKVMADNTTEVTGIQDGDLVKPGWTVVTGAGDLAELKVTYTGTIIKISQNTNFTIEGLRTETGGQDVFSLGVGKIRTVAGRASTKDRYQIKTLSSICGVRGSDVVVEFREGSTSRLYALEGTGWIQDLKTGQALDVPQGDFADSLAPAFQASPIPAEVLTDLQKEMNFVKLDPAEATSMEKAYEQEQQSQQQSSQSAAPDPAQSSFMENLFNALRNVLGFEIGTVAMNGLTYGEAILEPTFSAGNLKMVLYLPIIYQTNILYPADWYHPGGNNEWSFGTDQGGDPARVAADVTRDVLLKFKSVEYGQPRDPFFFRLGSVEDITIGHGLVMSDFANDADFPAVRRIGVNVGADFGAAGVELVVNDAVPAIVNGSVYPPDVVGGRLFVRPIPGFRGALGISTIVDFTPGKDFYDPSFTSYGPAAAGNPLFIYPGIDLEVPFTESNSFGLVFFTDAAFMLPFLGSSPTDPQFSSIAPGFARAAVYDPFSSIPLKNWGFSAGFFGNMIIPDFTWRLEYRLFTGVFQPQIYDSGFERTRSFSMLSFLHYVTSSSTAQFDDYNMGIYGEGGFKLSNVFALKVGYFWPWTVNASTGAWGFDPGDPDRFIVSFELQKGVISSVNLWGSISYERTNLFYGSNQPTSLNDAFFNANTDVSARVSYGVSPIMVISLLYTITPVFNPDGTLHYTGSSAFPDMASSLSIVTSINL